MNGRLSAQLERILADPGTGTPIRPVSDGLGEAFVSDTARYPIVRGIPRFVADDRYVASFSFEWNTHACTQLDSARDDRMSESTLVTKTGLTAADVSGKLVLDAGVGAGRFSEVLSRWGADVVGVDLSFAVEAAQANLGGRDNVWIAQADIGALPFRPESFDVIVSIGVLHHTPGTREYFMKLVPLLKRGGVIAIWVYPVSPHYVHRSNWVKFVNKLPARMYYEWCRWYVPWIKHNRERPIAQVLNQAFEVSNQPYGIENDILDTFDAYSPRHHFVHSPEEVEGWFRDAGLIEIGRPGNFETSVRGRKPG